MLAWSAVGQSVAIVLLMVWAWLERADCRRERKRADEAEAALDEANARADRLCDSLLTLQKRVQYALADSQACNVELPEAADADREG